MFGTQMESEDTIIMDCIIILISSLNKFKVVYNLAYCKCVSGLNCKVPIIVLCQICKIAKVQSLHNQASITTCFFCSVLCVMFFKQIFVQFLIIWSRFQATRQSFGLVFSLKLFGICHLIGTV